VVVHTTDMYPGTFDALVRAWVTRPGRGNAAHFLIGRTEADGVVQFAPITRNANHAGGPTHGNWRTPSGALVHPNTMSVGIELDCAGKLKLDSDGRAHYPADGWLIPKGDVDWSGRMPWHAVTGYQMENLRRLLLDLRAVLKPLESGWTVSPSGSYRDNGVSPWADPYGPHVVGHVSLDPVNKTDPGPQVMRALREVSWHK